MPQPDPKNPGAPDEPERSRSLIGTVTFLVSDEELIEPLYEDWEPDLVE
jgi:hypothetical protein